MWTAAPIRWPAAPRRAGRIKTRATTHSGGLSWKRHGPNSRLQVLTQEQWIWTRDVLKDGVLRVSNAVVLVEDTQPSRVHI